MLICETTSKLSLIVNSIDAGFFVSLKNPTPEQYKSSVVYEFKCPGCIKEHSSQATSEIYNHTITCNEFNYIKNILELTPDGNTNVNCSLTDLIFTNAKIIDKSIDIGHCYYINNQ